MRYNTHIMQAYTKTYTTNMQSHPPKQKKRGRALDSLSLVFCILSIICVLQSGAASYPQGLGCVVAASRCGLAVLLHAVAMVAHLRTSVYRFSDAYTEM